MDAGNYRFEYRYTVARGYQSQDPLSTQMREELCSCQVRAEMAVERSVTHSIEVFARHQNEETQLIIKELEMNLPTR
jgi:hypothetical protein